MIVIYLIVIIVNNTCTYFNKTCRFSAAIPYERWRRISHFSWECGKFATFLLVYGHFDNRYHARYMQTDHGIDTKYVIESNRWMKYHCMLDHRKCSQLVYVFFAYVEWFEIHGVYHLFNILMYHLLIILRRVILI